MARKKAMGLAVGHITCPNPMHPKPTLAIMRMKTNGVVYAYCGEGCGMLDWILPCGQAFFLEKGIWWPPKDGNPDKFAERIPPADLPEWIRFNRAFAPEELQAGGLDDAPPTHPVVPKVQPSQAHDPRPGDAGDLAPPAHQPKKKRKGAVMPWELGNDED